jgi:hypothetical protein
MSIALAVSSNDFGWPLFGFSAVDYSVCVSSNQSFSIFVEPEMFFSFDEMGLAITNSAISSVESESIISMMNHRGYSTRMQIDRDLSSEVIRKSVSSFFMCYPFNIIARIGAGSHTFAFQHIGLMRCHNQLLDECFNESCSWQDRNYPIIA